MRFSPLGFKSSVTVVLLAFGATSFACGPNFPNRFLVVGNSDLLHVPRATFAREVQRHLPASTEFKAVVPPRHGDVFKHSDEIAEEDLLDALRDAGIDPEDKIPMMIRYKILRKQLGKQTRALEYWQFQRARGRDVPSTPPVLGEIEFPEGLPAEFDAYLRGAVALARGDAPRARAAWQALLERTPAERARRSVWAAYRIGRSYVDEATEPTTGAAARDQAVHWFDHTRLLARSGFSDRLGLAAASLGWEARAELHCGNYRRAAQLYMQQWASGDERCVESLGTTVRLILDGGPEGMNIAAQDPLTRAVLTAYIISSKKDPRRAQTREAENWLAAIEALELKDVSGAFTFAWLAYQAADWAAAERWIDRADAKQPRVRWLRAKLWLRAGKVAEATELLAELCRSFEPAALPGDEAVLGVLATLRLATSDYEEALRLLLRGGHWLDAAYIAEQVLTLDEARAFARRHENVELRDLVGRRLARAGRLDEARQYLLPATTTILQRYQAHLAIGRDPAQSQAKRGAALWAAARLTKEHGLALFGTEEAPDWAALGGNFELTALGQSRANDDDAKDVQIAPASFDERQRAQRHQADPLKRWHYRYRAADLAWEALALMPDNSDATARVFCEAGGWLKNKDPLAADRFYKALVRRCGKTALGKEADRLRWFPR